MFREDVRAAGRRRLRRDEEEKEEQQEQCEAAQVREVGGIRY